MHVCKDKARLSYNIILYYPIAIYIVHNNFNTFSFTQSPELKVYYRNETQYQKLGFLNGVK